VGATSAIWSSRAATTPPALSLAAWAAGQIARGVVRVHGPSVRRHWKKAAALGASAFAAMSARRSFRGPVTPSQASRINHMQRRYEARQASMGRTRKPTRLAAGNYTGSYKGPLPKPKRPAKPGKYAMSGARAEVEKHGIQSLDHVVYLGAQSAPAFCMGGIVGQALIRKLMAIHYKVEYAHPASQLVPNVFAVSPYQHSPYNLKFIYKRTPPNLSTPTYAVGATFDFSVTGTLLTFGTWFATNVFNADVFGAADTEQQFTNELYAYQFSNVDYTAAAAGTVVAGPILPLERQYLTVYSTVRMHIQNITAADGTGSDTLQADRIDNNPIKGKLFRFSGPLPKLSDYRGIASTLQITPVPEENAYQLQQDTTPDGIIYPSVALTGVWAQVPNASQFSNCKGELAVNLAPGAMRDYTITFKYSGTLQRLMRGFSSKDALGRPRPNGVHQFGESFLFALEKRMPTGLTPAVTLNFHYEQYYGACLGARGRLPMARQADAGSVAAKDQSA